MISRGKTVEENNRKKTKTQKRIRSCWKLSICPRNTRKSPKKTEIIGFWLNFSALFRVFRGRIFLFYQSFFIFQTVSKKLPTEDTEVNDRFLFSMFSVGNSFAPFRGCQIFAKTSKSSCSSVSETVRKSISTSSSVILAMTGGRENRRLCSSLETDIS